MHTASVLYPSQNSWLGCGRELVAGSPVMPSALIAVTADGYEPEDLPTFLRDEGLRAVQSLLFGEVLGPEHASFSFGGPAFFGTDGYWLDNVFGDLSSTSNGTLGTAQNLSAALAIGATSLAVGVSLGSVGTGSVIQISDGAASEIVIATAGSTGTAVNFTSTPCRFAHTTAATAALETASSNYTHVFAQLNSGTGQPPVHSLTDVTGITPTVGARTYPGAVVTSLDYVFAAGSLPSRKVAGISAISAPSASAPVASPDGEVPVAAWRSTVTVGGSAVYGVAQWGLSLHRDTQMYFSAQGAQSPSVIPRGALSAQFALDFTPAVSESPLTDMTAGLPLALSFTISNGVAGASALSMTVTASKGQAVRARPSRAGVAIGYPTEWDAVSNSTDIGGSGGLGPLTVQLVNAISTY